MVSSTRLPKILFCLYLFFPRGPRLPRFSVSHLLGQPFVIVSPFVERQLEPLIVVPAMGVRPLIQPVITAPEREELSECEKENRGTDNPPAGAHFERAAVQKHDELSDKHG